MTDDRNRCACVNFIVANWNRVQGNFDRNWFAITTVMYCLQTIGSIILLFSIHVMALFVLPLSLWSMLMASLLVSFSLADFHQVASLLAEGAFYLIVLEGASRCQMRSTTAVAGDISPLGRCWSLVCRGLLVKNLLLWSWRQLELVHSFEVLGIPFSSLDSLGERVGLFLRGASFECLHAERRRQGDPEASLRAWIVNLTIHAESESP